MIPDDIYRDYIFKLNPGDLVRDIYNGAYYIVLTKPKAENTYFQLLKLTQFVGSNPHRFWSFSVCVSEQDLELIYNGKNLNKK